MIGLRLGHVRYMAMPMPVMSRRPTRFKEVDMLRIAMSAPRSWLGLLGIVLLRLPAILAMTYLLVR